MDVIIKGYRTPINFQSIARSFRTNRPFRALGRAFRFVRVFQMTEVRINKSAETRSSSLTIGRYQEFIEPRSQWNFAISNTVSRGRMS